MLCNGKTKRILIPTGRFVIVLIAQQQLTQLCFVLIELSRTTSFYGASLDFQYSSTLNGKSLLGQLLESQKKKQHRRMTMERQNNVEKAFCETNKRIVKLCTRRVALRISVKSLQQIFLLLLPKINIFIHVRKVK